MYFKKATLLFVLIAFIAICEAGARRKSIKTRKVKKGNYPKVAASPCGCQNPLLEIINCGCNVPSIEPVLSTLGPIEISIPFSQSPVIHAPRPSEIIEFNPLGCMFPSIDIPNYGNLPTLMTTPMVEYLPVVDLPCGCPISKCGCHTPPVNLPLYPEYLATLEIPDNGFQSLQISSVPSYSYGTTVIEIPSYTPAPVIQGFYGSTSSPCGCQGPCSCPGISISSCGCQEPCSCAEFQMISCNCEGPCSCPRIPISPCGCSGPCGCAGIPKACGCSGSCGCTSTSKACGCSGSCGCAGTPKACGCPGPCGCPIIQATVDLLPSIDIPSCGCQGPFACPGSCGCSGPCGCHLQKASGLLPAIELPVCACNNPGCNCPQYLRQVTMQPPFL